MPDGEKTEAVELRSILLLLLAPIWAPVFLLLQAVRLCGDGLIQLYEEGRGRVVHLPAAVRWLIGVPALLLFPLLVGLRAVLALILGLGDAGLRRLAPLWLWLLLALLLAAAGRLLLRPSWTSVPTGLAYGAALLLVVSALLAALGRRGLLRAPTRLLVGLVAIISCPVWLPLGTVIWIVKWVLWKLLVPEFRRSLQADTGRGDHRLVTFVGLRYLFSRRETALHSATNYYAAGGIALGVCALIVVLAVMSGFEQEVRERIIGTNAHVILLRFGPQGIAASDSLAERVGEHPEVEEISPFVFGKAMLSAGTAAEGAMIKGVEWEAETRVTALGRYVRDLEDPGLLAAAPGRAPGIILGKHIVENLGLIVGDEVVLVSPSEVRRTPLGFVPRMRRFQLCGIFDSGMYDFDANMAFIGLTEGQSFFGLGERVTGLEIRVREMNRAPQVADEITALCGGFPFRTNNWIDLNANLFAWMKTEKRAMFVILTMIILVAGFNIASSLIMLVTEKRREIGILKSMGTTAMGVLRIFVLEGWVIALAGTAVGVATGLGICDLIARHRLIRLPEDIYFIDTLPVRVEAGDVWVIVVSVLVIAALSTLYPAWRASRLDPVEAIRAE